MPDPRPHGRRRRPQRGIVVGTVAVLVLAAAGIGAYAATNPSGTRYRTAKVATDAVTQTLTETGTAAPETSATASFADNGSVQSVAVQAGQTVTAGQVLAQLNTVTLNATLQAAKATAAQDALVLAAAENGQTLSVDGTGGSSGSTGSSFSTHTSADLFSPGTSAGSATLLATTTSTVVIAAGGRPSSGSGSGTTSTSALQDAVTGEQRALDSDLSDAGRSLAAAEGSCPSAVTVPSSGDTPSPSSSASPSASPTRDPTDAPTPTPSPTADPTSCLAGETSLLSAQRKVAADEASLATAEAALDSALTASQSAPSTDGTTTSRGGASPNATGGKTTTGSGSTAVPTAADIAADQAAVDAGNAAVAVAEQTLTMATLVSPIGGTVLSVGFTAGASSSGRSIEVADPGGYVFDTTVAVTSIPDIKIGESVAVTPDGTNTVVRGTVVLIAAAPNPSGTYPIVIGVDGTPPNVRSGSSASLVITLSTSTAGLTVPTSAITTVGALKIVRVLSGSTVTAVPVTVVTMGGIESQVRAMRDGALAAGDQVVIADLGAALPASNSTTTSTRGGLTSGLGGTSGLTGTSGLGGGTGRIGGGTGRG